MIESKEILEVNDNIEAVEFKENLEVNDNVEVIESKEDFEINDNIETNNNFVNDELIENESTDEIKQIDIDPRRNSMERKLSKDEKIENVLGRKMKYEDFKDEEKRRRLKKYLLYKNSRI